MGRGYVMSIATLRVQPTTLHSSSYWSTDSNTLGIPRGQFVATTQHQLKTGEGLVQAVCEEGAPEESYPWPSEAHGQIWKDLQLKIYLK